ncbi:MAG: rhodanese-like domain-containing protein [Mycobacterium kyogaense]|uniref:rhodanese-like domain-containing protein n=1 Tax=Mycobacterium kyogaense TaxID=2212479 RepID=UPI002FF6F2FC
MDHTGVRQAGIAEIPAEFDLSSEGPVLLDVREDDEWRLGHAPGARHIPMGEVPARMSEIPADADLYVICHLGGRSQRVADYLARNGYSPVNVSGGMEAWAGAGRPVVTDDGQPGTV